MSLAKTGRTLLAAAALLLLAAQALASLHTLEHEPGFTPGPLCAVCVAATNLSTTCVDHSLDAPVAVSNADNDRNLLPDGSSAELSDIRQRGPPPAP